MSGISDETPAEPQSAAQMQADLGEIAALLRNADHLEPETQKSLASLLEELGQELNSSGSISDKTARLTHAVRDAARSLHERESTDLIGNARDQLKDAAATVETEAPVITGVVYRIIDVLSSIGI